MVKKDGPSVTRAEGVRVGLTKIHQVFFYKRLQSARAGPNPQVSSIVPFALVSGLRTTEAFMMP